MGRQLILLLFVCGYLFMLCHTLARFPPPSSPSSSPFAAPDPTPGGRAGPMAGCFFVFSFSSADAPAVDGGGMVGPMDGPAGGEGFCRCGGKAGPIAADALLPRSFSSSFFFCRCGGSAGPMVVEGAPSPCCCGCGFFCRWGGSAGPIDAPAGRAAAAVARAPELVEVDAEP